MKKGEMTSQARDAKTNILAYYVYVLNANKAIGDYFLFKLQYKICTIAYFSVQKLYHTVQNLYYHMQRETVFTSLKITSVSRVKHCEGCNPYNRGAL